MEKDDFIFENKEALLEEIAMSLTDIEKAFIQAINSTPMENPAHDAATFRNATIEASKHLGFALACLRQYIAFTKMDASVFKQLPVGFNRFEKENIKKNKKQHINCDE